MCSVPSSTIGATISSSEHSPAFSNRKPTYPTQESNIDQSLVEIIRETQYPTGPDLGFSYGTVVSYADGVAMVGNLTTSLVGEICTFAKKASGQSPIIGLVMSLEYEVTGVSLLGESENPKHLEIREGTSVIATGRLAETTVGQKMFGRILNFVGDPVDGLGHASPEGKVPVEAEAQSVLDRRPVNEPLFTGLVSFDALIPIGLGQREAIMGDRRTGKTEAALTMTSCQNQLDTETGILYAAIGQKASTITSLVATLRERGIFESMILMAAPLSYTCTSRYILPYSAVASAEWFARGGKSTVAVYDDLSKHSDAYSELCLLLRRTPGIDSLPVDIFSQHAKLLERAGAFKSIKGSITALPIVELDNGDLSGYVPTNIVSITDGQAVFDAELFAQGFKPALNTQLSVSRLGGAVQPPALREVSGKLKRSLVEVKSTRRIAELTSDLDKTARTILKEGEILDEVLKQEKNEVSMPLRSVYLLEVCLGRALNEVPSKDVKRILAYLLENADSSSITKALAENRKLSSEERDAILKEAATLIEETL